MSTVQSDRLWDSAEGYWSQHARTGIVKQKHPEHREILDEYFVYGKGLESLKPLGPSQESHTKSPMPEVRPVYKSVNGITVSRSKSETDKMH